MTALPAPHGVIPIAWQSGALHLLDQRRLPHEVTWVVCTTAADVATAIREMVVRGAPAIGISAAYGVVLSAKGEGARDRERIAADIALLAASRPTAVNLFWALSRMQRCVSVLDDERLSAMLEQEAIRIHREDFAGNLKMGELGAAVIAQECQVPAEVITHCNAGALATSGYGTALGVIRSAWKAGMISHVYADETRPWLQGARLTAWELAEEGIPVTLLADVAAAHVMKTRGVKWVIVGADRITARGDVANKIGTYSLAVLARHHGVKLMVVAPMSTVDFDLSSGDDIVIEERDSEELRSFSGHRVAATGAGAFNPVFDVTPAELVDVIVTERGVVHQPSFQAMAALRP